MTAPSESHAPQSPRTPARVLGAAPGNRDRLLAALVAIVDDLTVERDEAGLLRSTLEHVVSSLELIGGAIFVAADGELVEVAEQHVAVEIQALRELAGAAMQQDGPLVQELPGAGHLGGDAAALGSAHARSARAPRRAGRGRGLGARPRGARGARQADRHGPRERPALRRAARVLGARRSAAPHHRGRSPPASSSARSSRRSPASSRRCSPSTGSPAASSTTPATTSRS